VELRLELPPEVFALLGPTPEAAAQAARKALVLDLLRQGRVSQGRAAQVLGITRHDIIDLMAAHEIPSGPLTVEEFREDVAAAKEFMQPQPSKQP
jgi:predicted HTH domain antitoxin